MFKRVCKFSPARLIKYDATNLEANAGTMNDGDKPVPNIFHSL